MAPCSEPSTPIVGKYFSVLKMHMAFHSVYLIKMSAVFPGKSRTLQKGQR
jgi:hypothetical protein